MLIVSGILEIEPDDAEAAFAAARTMAAATREEAGCHSYAFYSDIEDSGRIRVFEEWEDGAALEAHFASAHMAEFRKALSAVKIRSRSVWRYEVGEKKEL